MAGGTPGMRKPSRPTALKLLAGEQNSKINHDEPQPEEGIPQCPSEDLRTRKVWDYTVKQLSRMRVLTMADRDVLFAYVQAVAMHQEASEVISREGTMIMVRGLGAAAPHPAIGVQQKASTIIKALGVEFGLTPAARSRIKVGDQKPEQTQGASRLLSS